MEETGGKKFMTIEGFCSQIPFLTLDFGDSALWGWFRQGRGSGIPISRPQTQKEWQLDVYLHILH